jgi:hypothetical protein
MESGHLYRHGSNGLMPRPNESVRPATHPSTQFREPARIAITIAYGQGRPPHHNGGGPHRPAASANIIVAASSAGSTILNAPGRTLEMGPTKKENSIAYKIIVNS